MLPPPPWASCALAALLCAGCGRFGLELLALEQQPAEAGLPDLGAAESTADADIAAADGAAAANEADGAALGAGAGLMDAASAASPDAALTTNDAGSAPFDAAAATKDAATADAASSTDAASGAHDSGSDAAADASATDSSVPDAAPPPDCQLLVGGASVGYRTGEIGTLNGTHILTLEQTDQCAIPSACSNDSGQDVVQASCSITPCRMWESVDAGSGWFRLRNASSGLCLYMSDTAAGTSVSSYECFTSDQMHWQATCAGNDSWYLTNEYSGLALGAGSSGAIVQSTQTGAQQRWTITTNPSAYTVVMTAADSDSNAIWRYTTSAPSSSWMQSSFNDSRWSTGAGAFADMRRGSAPLGTSWTSQDIWLRRTFSLSSIPASLTVKVFHDEGTEIYINGASVATLTQWSNGYVAVDVPASVLRSLVVGTNSIAAHCTNSTGSQIIDIGLVTFTWH